MVEDSKVTIVELDIKKIAKVNLWLTVVLCIAFVVLNSMIHQRFSASFSFWDILLFMVGYVVLIILHEIFHLVGFMLFGKVQFKNLNYGVNLKLGVAYATTTIPLNNSAMKKALLLPFWTTGVIPTMLGFIFNSYLLVLLGAVLIAGAIGDFYMYRELRKFPNHVLVKDDPELPRLYIHE